ncbi:MAG: primosomal protein N' [Ktedonobacteraceae bacterium]|nr:primosomal protein N' [Ktedonobacteraceae bacterium]
MLAEVLTSAASWNSEQSLLTYRVPDELQAALCCGQLVAVPYRERLVEGIVWRIDRQQDSTGEAMEREEQATDVTGEPLRAIRTILDTEPALLSHQMALAQWIAEYYVTPLARVVQMMLPPGLMQRTRSVLRLAEDDPTMLEQAAREVSPRLRALIGLLLSDGELDTESLKKMLGASKAREVLREIRAGTLVEADSQLQPPRARVRVKRIVRLAAQGEALLLWRERMEARLQQKLAEATEAAESAEAQEAQETSPASLATTSDHLRSRSHEKKSRTAPNPWALPASPIAVSPLLLASGAVLTLTPQDRESLLIRRQLAAIDLLMQDARAMPHWTPGALCKASGLTAAQLQRLVNNGLVLIEEVEVRRDPLQGRTLPISQPLTLTKDQQEAVQYILAEAQKATGAPILLHGVTGSGKTEVYLQALAAIIAQGKRGIVLVPEIALTTQAVQRVASRFPDRVAIIHSELGLGERYDEWRRIRAGQVDVVIGSRSALFAPVPDLGLIIVDEEHEAAYKQSERRPLYHAREAAIRLGQILRIPVVLGSATPSVESFYRAEQGEYRLSELPARIGAALPPVEVIDLRSELRAGNTSIISRRLNEELERVLSQGQQAILFLNRRGSASCVLCRDCGNVALCDRCDIPLTYHSTERILLCHYCGRQARILHFCPACKSSAIRYFGVGTEKVQATIQQHFPSARLLRWDRDTARNRRAHEQLLDRFANREADILVGTQMIAKGLDLPGVTLVGVVSADIALNLPDFAASERAFTLLTQVAGRAGRGEEPGHVIIQTFNPQHFCIEAAANHDYHQFYLAEIEARQRYGYPPFRRFVKFTYTHENRHRCQNEALLLYEHLAAWIARLELANTDIVGPAPALLERIRDRYRWQMIVRGPDLHPLLRVIDAPGWEIDIDPVSTL